jgi:hypothetical protein
MLATAKNIGSTVSMAGKQRMACRLDSDRENRNTPRDTSLTECNTSYSQITTFLRKEQKKCAYNYVSILIFWNCVENIDFNCIFLFVFVLRFCGCYSFELKRSINQKWAIFKS